MTADPGPEHDELAELLPDYAVGALGEAEHERVAAHLEGCAACRRELADLTELLARLVDAAPPSADVKTALLARVAAEPQLAASPPVPAPAPPRLDVPVPRVPQTRRAGFAPVGRWRLAWLGAAAVVLAVIGLGAWNLSLQRQLDERSEMSALLGEAAEVYLLTDSQLSPPATGVLVSDPASREAVLVVQRLPALGADQRFQLWLFAEGGERVSGGLLDANAAGDLDEHFRAPQALGAYVAVALSVEPETGSPQPTSALVLGGWLQHD